MSFTTYLMYFEFGTFVYIIYLVILYFQCLNVLQGRLKEQPRGFKWTPWSGPLKKKLYVIFFFNLVLIPTKINMNTLTLNFWLSSIEISLNMILSFYVVLVFINVQSSSLISALQISKSKKSLLLTPIPKKWLHVYL